MCIYRDYCVYHYKSTELVYLYTLDIGLQINNNTIIIRNIIIRVRLPPTITSACNMTSSPTTSLTTSTGTLTSLSADKMVPAYNSVDRSYYVNNQKCEAICVPPLTYLSYSHDTIFSSTECCILKYI